MKLDSIDKKLLNILQIDGKKTAKQLSETLNLSVTAIYERIKKLENNHVIEKYVAVINKSKINRNYIVLCQVKLKQHHNTYIDRFEKEVHQFDEVLECFNISGDYDYQLKIIVENMQAYRKFLNGKLTRLDYIGSTYSTFIISEVKSSSAIIC
jgi:Lrp/AsnC family leucine-responsive transcriptional regulator